MILATERVKKMTFNAKNDASRNRPLVGSFLILALAALVAFCPVGPAFAADPYFDGSGIASDPFQIPDASHLETLSVLVNSADANPKYGIAYYVVSDDITFDPATVTWTPIGVNGSLPFSGSFDGNDKTITGLSVDVTGDYDGLFGYILGSSSTLASVKDLTIQDVNITGGRYVGAVAGYASYADIENCKTDGGVISSDYAISEVGGIVGYATNTSISECVNSADVEGLGYRAGGIAGYISRSTVTNSDNAGAVSGVSYVGGIVGYASTTFAIEGCNNANTVAGTTNYIGGIVGYASNVGNVTGCYNTGAVTGDYEVGGIVGYAYTSVNIISDYNGADIITSGDNVGGIAGAIDNRSIVTNCFNEGAVAGETGVGGIVGDTNVSSISQSQNAADVAGTGDHVGGVTGDLYSGSIDNCYSTGQINIPSERPPYPFGDYVGGIAGEAQGSTVLNCYVTGDVYGDNYVGGITGTLSSSTVTASVALGAEVIGTGRYSGRVSGYPAYDSAVYANCFANEDMLPGSGGYDGDDVSLTDAQGSVFWLNIGWDPNVWSFGSRNFPQLLNLPQPPTSSFDIEDEEYGGIGGV
jgi:hypothetical protein